jgi:lysyl-tRNA synthetase class 2
MLPRSTAVEELKQNGAHPYPHKFHVSVSLTHFLEQYASLKVRGNFFYI